MNRIEVLLLSQSLLVFAWCAATVGVKEPWAPWASLVFVALGGVSLIGWKLNSQGSGPSRQAPGISGKKGLSALWAPHPFWPLVPLCLYTIYYAVAMANLSHVPDEQGGWLPRPDWIPWLPTAIDRSISTQAALPWFAALGQAGIVAAGLRTRAALRGLAIGMAAVVVILALVGSVVHFSGETLALGILPVPADYFFATFLYKNHWAAFALLGAATTAGLAFSAWDRSWENRRIRSERLGWFAAFLLIVMTLPLPGSRSGTLFGMLLVLCVVRAAFIRLSRKGERTPSPRRLLLLSILTLLLIVSAAWLSREPLLRAYHKTQTQLNAGGADGPIYLRLNTAADTIRMAAERPLFGWGPGSFYFVFPLFQGDYLRDREGKPTSYFDAAHCDWVQMAAEYGWGAAVVMLALVLIGAMRIRRYSSRWAQWTFLGLILIAIYAIGEFPLQNRAVLLFCAMLFAAAGRWNEDLRYRRQS